ncbi:MAG: type II secretion system protein GspJ [Candidatus Omnitrophica bacterium]|nr:type II secretion system protein GspJ [Candidatus Omnitrophota bacterium]
MTLVELLIVAGLAAIISLALYSVLGNGLQVWKRTQKVFIEEDVLVFFEKLSSDLNNGIHFNGLDFGGNSENFECATLIYDPLFSAYTIGKTLYSYESSGAITRTQKNYSQIFTGEEVAASRLVPQVASARFSYYVFDAQKEEYTWQPYYSSPRLPAAIRVELELQGDNVERIFTKTVAIPGHAFQSTP